MNLKRYSWHNVPRDSNDPIPFNREQRLRESYGRSLRTLNDVKDTTKTSALGAQYFVVERIDEQAFNNNIPLYNPKCFLNRDPPAKTFSQFSSPVWVLLGQKDSDNVIYKGFDHCTECELCNRSDPEGLLYLIQLTGEGVADSIVNSLESLPKDLWFVLCHSCFAGQQQLRDISDVVVHFWTCSLLEVFPFYYLFKGVSVMEEFAKCRDRQNNMPWKPSIQAFHDGLTLGFFKPDIIYGLDLPTMYGYFTSNSPIKRADNKSN